MAAMTPPVPLVLRSEERMEVMEKLVEVPAVLMKFVANKFVEVAFVVVPLFTVKRSIVDEALTMMPMVVVGVSAPLVTFQSLNAVGV